MKNVFAFLFGALFSVGLMVSGMSNPEKVLDFLDLFGDWDASLAFVMMGAITVAFIPFQKALRTAQPKTVFNEPIDLPKNNQIVKKLIRVAVLFVAGWGIAGICPAPVFTLIGLAPYQFSYFILQLLLVV